MKKILAYLIFSGFLLVHLTLTAQNTNSYRFKGGVGDGESQFVEVKDSIKTVITYCHVMLLVDMNNGTKNANADFAMLVTNLTTSKEFDNGWDGDKMFSAGYPSIYVHEGSRNYQINTSNDIDGTILGLCGATFITGDCKLLFNQYFPSVFNAYYTKWYLIDLANNAVTDITTSGTMYAFQDTNLNLHDRFQIVTHLGKKIGQNEDANNSTEKLTMFAVSNRLIVDNATGEKGQLLIYDVSGRMCMNRVIDSTPTSSIELGRLLPGIYIAKGQCGSANYTTKFIVR